LANRNIQPIEIFPHAGKQRLRWRGRPPPDWKSVELTAATLQIADLREFAAVIAGKKEPDFGHEHDLTVQRALLEACGMI
jgi:allantoicase